LPPRSVALARSPNATGSNSTTATPREPAITPRRSLPRTGLTRWSPIIEPSFQFALRERRPARHGGHSHGKFAETQGMCRWDQCAVQSSAVCLRAR
jgi:hypothetical protein